VKGFFRLSAASIVALGLLVGGVNLAPARAATEKRQGSVSIARPTSAPSSYYMEAVLTARSYCRSTYMHSTWHYSVRRSSAVNSINADGWQFSATVSGTLKNSTQWERKQVTITVRRVKGAWNTFVH
jgi:hypothetical protein